MSRTCHCYCFVTFSRSGRYSTFLRCHDIQTTCRLVNSRGKGGPAGPHHSDLQIIPTLDRFKDIGEHFKGEFERTGHDADCHLFQCHPLLFSHILCRAQHHTHGKSSPTTFLKFCLCGARKFSNLVYKEKVV